MMPDAAWNELKIVFAHSTPAMQDAVLIALGTHPGGDLPPFIRRQALDQGKTKHGTAKAVAVVLLAMTGVEVSL